MSNTTASAQNEVNFDFTHCPRLHLGNTSIGYAAKKETWFGLKTQSVVLYANNHQLTVRLAKGTFETSLLLLLLGFAAFALLVLKGFRARLPASQPKSF